jgi:hypothetical protein
MSFADAKDFAMGALRAAERASLAVEETIGKGDSTDRRAQRRARAALLRTRLGLKALLAELSAADPMPRRPSPIPVGEGRVVDLASARTRHRSDTNTGD